MRAALHFAVRRLRRGWRSGELLILTLAIAVAVAALSAVGLFTDRVRQAVENQTGETMGADVLFNARDPLPADLVRQVEDTGARTEQVVQFPTVIARGEATALAAMKAVGPAYPLRGQLRISRTPFGETEVVAGGPPRGEAWVDLRLWQDLDLALGVTLQIGASALRVGAIIDNEPDRGNGFADLAPRMMIALADLPATNLLVVGSRAQYTLMAAGTPEQAAALAALSVPRGVRRMTPADVRPEIRSAMKTAGQFLDLAVLATTLLAAAAIALCAHQYGSKLRDEVALLKCLGARQQFLVDGLALSLVMLGAVGALAGSAAGFAAQEAVAQVLQGVLAVDLPAARLAPILPAWGLGLVMLIGFGLPPVLQARSVPPVRVFQRNLGNQGAPRAVALAAAATVAVLLWFQTGDPTLAVAVLGGAAATVLALAGLAWLLVASLAPLRRQVGTSWRFGLGNVARRRGATVAQVVALGLALLALLLVSVVRQDLLASWRARLPADTPNQFLVNIQPQQLEALRAFFAERGIDNLRFWPMARGRLVALNGAPVTPESFADPETQRWINRDFNLSWTDTLNEDNAITAGQWWGPEGRGQRWLSVDAYGVERLGLELGDRMTIDFAGEPIEFTVKNLRTVEWDSFRPNFFLLAPPGVVEHLPAQWLTSLLVTREQRGVLRELITEFPNVTALDIEHMMNQIRGIMDRIVTAVEFLFLFTLAAGLTVLLAAIEGTRAERVRETGLLRTLGAGSATIAKGLLAEYAVLGLLAGTVAAIAAQAVAWVLAEQAFRIDYGLRPMLWVTGALAGGGVVAALGWLSLRRVLATPPRVVLHGG